MFDLLSLEVIPKNKSQGVRLGNEQISLGHHPAGDQALWENFPHMFHWLSCLMSCGIVLLKPRRHRYCLRSKVLQYAICRNRTTYSLLPPMWRPSLKFMGWSRIDTHRWFKRSFIVKVTQQHFLKRPLTLFDNKEGNIQKHGWTIPCTRFQLIKTFVWNLERKSYIIRNAKIFGSIWNNLKYRVNVAHFIPGLTLFKHVNLHHVMFASPLFQHCVEKLTISNIYFQ